MALEKYRQKRNFKKTNEPTAKKKSSKNDLRFVVQKHNATRLHYDFRLELDGVLKSWAVPKGPSLNPADKRLAMMVEDHPYDYRSFEGIIPEGNYGAGEVIVWDEGTYHSLQSDNKKESVKYLHEGLNKGDLKFVLHGKKLNGAYALVKMKGRGENSWLLIKKKDEFAADEDITKDEGSVLSGKTLNDIKSSSPNIKKWISNRSSNGNEKSGTNTKFKLEKEFISKWKLSEKKMPASVKPMLATLVKESFDDKEWLFEIKWDGYRAIAEIKDAKVKLHSRNNLSFNTKFAAIAAELKSISGNTILDGEIVVVDENGKASFQLLQNYQRTGNGNIIFYVFDILYLDKYDLTELPLIERKNILKEFLPDLEKIKFSDHISEKGKEFFKLAQENSIEGIIAKKTSSVYQVNKRSRDWLKIKTSLRQEAIICGFTKPRGSRNAFGALVLGIYDNDELIYIGHTGSGFDEKSLKFVKKKLDPLITKNSPFKKIPKTNMPVTWVKPELVCEVNFSEWTDDNSMRHPIFMGIREDKNAREVTKEMAAETSPAKDNKTKNTKKKSTSKKSGGKNSKLKLTNLDKIYFPDEGYTKGDIIEYYDKISKYILPYLKNRPESLNRHPNGINGESFYQKDMRDTVPDWADTKLIYSESNDKDINYFICNDKQSLLYLVNLGCIEINPWFSRVQSLENPDYAVIDLDPEEISFEKVIETALCVKEVLDEAGAKSYCKTSGATGLHIYIPLKAKYDYDVAKDFAHLIGKIVHSRIPVITSLERSPSKRKKKVYLDYLQNRKGQTLAAPYSVRPKPGATVATPLEWSEVKSGLNPKDFTIKTIHKRIEKKGDIFKPVLWAGISIQKILKKLEKM